MKCSDFLIVCTILASLASLTSCAPVSKEGRDAVDTAQHDDNADAVHAVTGFTEMGTLVAPVTMHHVKYVVTWEDLDHTFTKTLELVSRAYEDWAKKVRASDDDDDAKTSRILRTESLISGYSKEVRQNIDEFHHMTRPKEDTRKERFISTILGLLGIGSGLYASKEVESLNTRVVANHQEVKVGRKALSDLKNSVMQWSNQITESHMDDTFVLQIRDSLTRLNLEVYNLKDGLVAARQNVIHLSILTFADSELLYDAVVKNSSARGLGPVYSGMDMIYQAEVSHIITSEQLVLFLHIPLTHGPQAIKTLYRAEPARISKSGTTLTLSTRENFFAISRDGSEYLSVSSDDLIGCHGSDSMHFCPHVSAFYSTPSSCVACLYFQDPVCAVKLCEHSWGPSAEEVLQVDARRYVFRDLTMITVTCPGKEQQVLHVREVVLEEGCYAISTSFSLRPSEDSLVAMSSVKRGTLNISLPLLGVDDDDFFKQAADNLRKVSVPPVRPLPPQIASLWHIAMIVMIILIVIGCLVLLGVAAYCIYRKVTDTVDKVANVVGQGEDVPARGGSVERTVPASKIGAASTVRTTAANEARSVTTGQAGVAGAAAAVGRLPLLAEGLAML